MMFLKILCICYHLKSLLMKTQLMKTNKNVHFYLKLRIPIMHREFFRKISQNRDYTQTYCNDRRNPFPIACHQWYLNNNPQC